MFKRFSEERPEIGKRFLYVTIKDRPDELQGVTAASLGKLINDREFVDEDGGIDNISNKSGYSILTQSIWAYLPDDYVFDFEVVEKKKITERLMELELEKKELEKRLSLQLFDPSDD